MSYVPKNTEPARDLIVRALEGSPQGLSIDDMAAKVFRGRATIVNNIAPLRKAGLIERVITYRLKKGEQA